MPRSVYLILSILVTILCLLRCKSSEPPAQEQKSATAGSKTLIDTNQNRLLLAQRVIAAYPNKEFGQFVRREVGRVVGKEVTDVARQRFNEKVSQEEFLAKRAEFLIKTFSTAELEELSRLLSSATGQSVYEKISRHEQLWKDYLTPVLLEVMSAGEE